MRFWCRCSWNLQETLEDLGAYSTILIMPETRKGPKAWSDLLCH